MAGSLSDQSGAQSHLGGPGVFEPLHIPPPPSFADFRFNTIGQEPELLKRISVPGPDFQYNEDRASPTPSLQYPSHTPEPSRSRPSLLQALTDFNDHNDVDMPDATNEISLDKSLSQLTETKRNGEIINTQLPPATGSPIQHGLRGWSEGFGVDNTEPIAPIESRSSALSNMSDQVPANTIFQEALQAFSSAIHTAGTPSLTPVTTSDKDTNMSVHPSPSLSAPESRYTTLRTLQVRLMSTLDDIRIPDNSNALLLVQAAHTHSTNALSTAHRSHMVAQQAVATAREAVTAAQDSLNAAEKAKAHASDALAAVEQMGGTRGSKSEWEWKTIISGLQSDLQILGEWIREMEGEEAAKRREMEKLAKEKIDGASVNNAMKTTEGSLSPRTIQALVNEVTRISRKDEARSKLIPNEMDNNSFLPFGQQLHRTAELEADDARRAWSLEHGLLSKSIVTNETRQCQQAFPGEVREQENQGAQESEALSKEAKLREELQKREDARIQEEHREAEVRAQRVRELELQKLEVAKFRMLERERQVQQVFESATDVLRMQRDMEHRKLTEAEAQKQRAQLEEQAEKVAAQAAALKAEVLSRERKKAEAVEKKEAEARAAEAIAAEGKAAEAKIAEEQAAARATEAREMELREIQSRKRQEVMARKQRASAETAARIIAERARERGEKSTSPAQPHISLKALTHPLPSPEYQNSPLFPLQTSGYDETPKHQDRAVSGGAKLGTAEGSNTPPSPHLSRSTTVGPIPQRRGRPIPLPPLPLPHPKIKLNEILSSTSKANSPPTTPPMRSDQLLDSTPNSNPVDEIPSVHLRSRDSGNLPIIPNSQLPPTSPEVQAANLRFVRSRSDSSRNRHLKPEHKTVHIKSEPLTETQLSAPSFGAMKRKVTGQVGPAFPKRPKVRRESYSNEKLENEPQSPVVPPTPDLAPTPATVPRVSPSVHILPSDTLLEAPNVTLPQATKDTLTATTPIPPSLKPALPNFRTGESSGSSTESSFTTHKYTSTRPLSRSTPQASKSLEASPTQPQSLDEGSPSNAISSSFEPTFMPAINRSQPESNFNRATTNMYRTTTEFNRGNTLASKTYAPSGRREIAPNRHEGAQIVPAIQGEGGRDTPAQGNEDSYGGPLRVREVPPRYASRNDDHYSPVERTSPESLSSPSRYPSLNTHETHRSTNTSYASGPSRWPDLHISTPVSRARTPPRPTSISPPRSPYLGKRRRWSGDEPPSQRYGQSNVEHDRTDRLLRPRPTDAPPPTGSIQRSATTERFGELHSRIGVRGSDVYYAGGGQSYRPFYPSDSYSSQDRRSSDSYQPSEFSHSRYEQDFGSVHTQLPPYDWYGPTGYPEVAEAPFLLERMSTRASPTHIRGAGPPRGFSRGRGRGGKSLEQRISSNQIAQPMTLMNRLET